MSKLTSFPEEVFNFFWESSLTKGGERDVKSKGYQTMNKKWEGGKMFRVEEDTVPGCGENLQIWIFRVYEESNLWGRIEIVSYEKGAKTIIDMRDAKIGYLGCKQVKPHEAQGLIEELRRGEIASTKLFEIEDSLTPPCGGA